MSFEELVEDVSKHETLQRRSQISGVRDALSVCSVMEAQESNVEYVTSEPKGKYFMEGRDGKWYVRGA